VPWVERLIDFLVECWPVQVVQPDQRAMLTLFGRWPKVVGPGVWFVVPGLMRCEKREVTAQTIGAGPFDYGQRTISVGIEYTISDLKRYLLSSVSVDESMRLEVASVVEAVVEENGDCAETLSARTQTRLRQIAQKRWGVQVSNVATETDLQPIAIRHIGSAWEEIA